MLHCEDTRCNQLSHLENGACTIKLKCFASVDQMDAALFPLQCPQPLSLAALQLPVTNMLREDILIISIRQEPLTLLPICAFHPDGKRQNL